MELVLGTVQFGLAYGVAGRDAPVPANEIRAILAAAWDQGVRTLDTAAAYGDIEQRLAALAGEWPFDVVTKLPPVPDAMPAAAAADWAQATLERSRERLGRHLRAVLFHRAEDLLDPSRGAALWDRCAAWCRSGAVRLGASAYEPATPSKLLERFGLEIVQLPGNALDQRLASTPLQPPGLQVHVRSAFLQGLLLMDSARATARVPAAASALARWKAWTAARGLPPLDAALSLVKGLPGATHCVVGVDDLSQFQAIAAAWRRAVPLRAFNLAETDEAVIDPRRWPAQQA